MTAAEIALSVEEKARIYTGGAWTPGDAPDPGGALVAVFAHLAGLVVDRLNRAPDKAFDAFLNMVGVSQMPPEPARAPLTFSVARGAGGAARVPAGTRVAAVSVPGEDDPPVFETEHELFPTGAALVAAFFDDPAKDSWSDLSPSVAEPPGTVAAGSLVFRAARPVARRLWIDSPVFEGVGQRDVTVTILTEPGADALPDVDWGWWDGAAWHALPASPSPGLSGGLQARFLRLAPIPTATAVEDNGAETPFRGTWIGARLGGAAAGDASVPRGWRVASVAVGVSLTRSALSPDAVVGAGGAIDASKDFLPFGERPRLGDAFLIASAEAFAPAGPVDGQHPQTVTVALTASDVEGGRLPPPDPAATEDGDVTLAWEYWDGTRWRILGRSSRTKLLTDAPDGDYGFSDGTLALKGLGAGAHGTVTFRRPADWAPSTVAGHLGHWLRVRIASGGYGCDAGYAAAAGRAGFTLVPATWRPPSLRAVALGYDYASAHLPPRRVLVENDQALVEAKGGGAEQTSPPAAGATTPSLCLGFQRPGSDRAFDDRPVTLFLDVTAQPHRPDRGEGPQGDAAPPEVTWEYRSRTGWRRLDARDDTLGLTRRGTVTFLGPADLAPAVAFGRTACWLRARLARDGHAVPPAIRRVLADTVWAQHATGVDAEVVGSGTGEAGLVLRTALTPVLSGQRLEVREAEVPSPDDLRALQSEESSGWAAPGWDGAGADAGVWVRWHEVPDFYGSGPGSRHYTLDRLTGAIGFGGDGRGRPPPRGPNSIRISYRSGGGRAGDRPAGAITQMKSAIPYVASVTNWVAAKGGADAQSLEEARRHGPSKLRHGDRAVAAVDYQDLAFMASPAVARAKCIPARGKGAAGRVELVVVPRGGGGQPTPRPDLLRQVQDYVAARAPAAVDLRVRGPEWLDLTVRVEVVPLRLEGAEAVREAVRGRVAAFLHPLTGGEGEGWPFGRCPHRSDLYAVVAAVPGVDHVRALELIYPDAPPPDGEATLVHGSGIEVALSTP